MFLHASVVWLPAEEPCACSWSLAYVFSVQWRSEGYRGSFGKLQYSTRMCHTSGSILRARPLASDSRKCAHVCTSAYVQIPRAVKRTSANDGSLCHDWWILGNEIWHSAKLNVWGYLSSFCKLRSFSKIIDIFKASVFSEKTSKRLTLRTKCSKSAEQLGHILWDVMILFRDELWGKADTKAAESCSRNSLFFVYSDATLSRVLQLLVEVSPWDAHSISMNKWGGRNSPIIFFVSWAI